MFSKWHWMILQLSRRLWVRAVLYALLAVVTVLSTIFFRELIPADLAGKIGAEAVDKILGILASGMLVVTTFSLSVMVAAFSSATSSISPRATRLLMEDSITQNVLGTFVGSFLFSLIGIIALNTGVYDNEGRVILFIVTLCVTVIIVATILIWIEHLSHLGRVSETSDKVEKAALAAVLQRAEHPWLGGLPLDSIQIPQDAKPVYSPEIGYIEHLDMKAVSQWADKTGSRVYINTLPGAFVHPKRVLAWIETTAESGADTVESAFSIARERSFDQDPRFGLSVLTEIASRALSPAVNDPGTAIEIIGRGVRLLFQWQTCEPNLEAAGKVEYPRLYIPSVTPAELFDDFFVPIARDGATMIEVQIRLQKALHALAQRGGAFHDNAKRHSDDALRRAEASLVFEGDKERLRTLVTDLFH